MMDESRYLDLAHGAFRRIIESMPILGVFRWY